MELPITPTTFSPLPASAGGLILGVSTCYYLLATGRLTGLSGFFDMLGSKDFSSTFYWKGPYAAGFVLGSLAIDSLLPGCVGLGGVSSSPLQLMTGGLLVGFGTRLANGCTSGHGISGLSRLSKRSIVAVATFMSVGVINSTTLAYHQLLGSPAVGSLVEPKSDTVRAVSLAAAVLALAKGTEMRIGFNTSWVSALCGAMFSVGLGISGMGDRAKIWNFLTLGPDNWDPSLMFVMGSAVPLCFFGFRFITKRFDKPLLAAAAESAPPKRAEGAPLLAPTGGSSSGPPKAEAEGGEGTHALTAGCPTSFQIPTNKVVDAKLVLGAAIFGVGWAVGGMCPGPAVMVGTTGSSSVALYYLPAMIVGMLGAKLVAQRRGGGSCPEETPKSK